jgi:quinol monooxygenase YgiN
MLIIAGHFDVDPAERDEYIRDREEGTRRSRGEDGCLAYAFSPDPLEPGRVLLYERWESKEALAAHIAGLRIGPQPTNSIKPISSEVLQYEISNVGQLGT